MCFFSYSSLSEIIGARWLFYCAVLWGIEVHGRFVSCGHLIVRAYMLQVPQTWYVQERRLDILPPLGQVRSQQFISARSSGRACLYGEQFSLFIRWVSNQPGPELSTKDHPCPRRWLQRAFTIKYKVLFWLNHHWRTGPMSYCTFVPKLWMQRPPI